MSQITTHVLDTARGVPASGIRISLQRPKDNGWETMATGITNDDGRITDLLAADDILPVGTYRMLFETGAYFESLNSPVFYPVVHIIFIVQDSAHYHIPLLLSPFGYSTYRGS